MEEVMDNEELCLLSEVDDDMKVVLKNDFTVDILMKFSSGQRNMLLSMSSIISNIGPHSLLLIDEPEQHMHPNGITAIMRSLFFYVAFQIIGKYLLFINCLLSIACAKCISTMTFEEAVTITPTLTLGTE